MKKITKKISFFIITFLIMHSYGKTADNLKNEISKIKKLDFHDAMHFSFQDKINLKQNKDIAKFYNFYKNIFCKNNLSTIVPSATPIIPHLLHQVWLGSEYPEKYRGIAGKWIKMHPGWKYKLWTDENIKELFPLYNQEHFDKCTNNGEKSDIIRYEILYRFGGIYFDTDYECFKSFEILTHCYDFIGGLEPFNISALFTGNALIGCAPGHPIIDTCIKTLKAYRSYEKLTMRTGPAHLTRAIMKTGYSKNMMIFPVGYIYPFSRYGKKIERSRANEYIYEESLGIHYWWGSWK